MQTTTHDGKTFTLSVENEIDQLFIDALNNNRTAYTVSTERTAHPSGGTTNTALTLICDLVCEQSLRTQAGSQALRAIGQIIGLGLSEATGGRHIAGLSINPKAQEQFAPSLEQLQVMADALGKVVRKIKLQSGVSAHGDSLVVSGLDIVNEGSPTWTTKPAQGMGLNYHWVYGFSTDAHLMHVSESEAHLIAAARDMKSALQDLLATMGSEAEDYYPHATQRALAALAKSNGVTA